MSRDLQPGLFDFAPPQRQVLTVSELNAAIRGVLDEEFTGVSVTGEISGSKLSPAGHFYFTLKDATSQIRCVIFKSTMRFLRFKPGDGLAVIARGRIDVYEPRGEYQLIIDLLELQGHGALQLAFEQLKKKLAAEGLFDTERKRPLPAFPRRIGLVTSPRGAVISDMLHVFERRSPGLHIRLYPALVQGEGSIEEVCAGIDFFSRTGWADLVIVARGGGSIEDLWTFNEEAVARAIAQCSVPVISAVGHETDVTIADFAADLRAPTPSAAAEVAVRNLSEVLDEIAAHRARAVQAMRYRVATLSRRLHEQGVERAAALLHRTAGRGMQRVDEQVFRLRDLMRSAIESRRRRAQSAEARVRELDPRPGLERGKRRLDAASAAAGHLVRARVAAMRSRFAAAEARLEQLSPLRVLERGYSIVTSESGAVITRAADAPPAIRVRLARGRLDATVTSMEE